MSETRCAGNQRRLRRPFFLSSRCLDDADALATADAPAATALTTADADRRNAPPPLSRHVARSSSCATPGSRPVFGPSTGATRDAVTIIVHCAPPRRNCSAGTGPHTRVLWLPGPAVRPRSTCPTHRPESGLGPKSRPPVHATADAPPPSSLSPPPIPDTDRGATAHAATGPSPPVTATKPTVGSRSSRKTRSCSASTPTPGGPWPVSLWPAPTIRPGPRSGPTDRNGRSDAGRLCPHRPAGRSPNQSDGSRVRSPDGPRSLAVAVVDRRSLAGGSRLPRSKPGPVAVGVRRRRTTAGIAAGKPPVPAAAGPSAAWRRWPLHEHAGSDRPGPGWWLARCRAERGTDRENDGRRGAVGCAR